MQKFACSIWMWQTLHYLSSTPLHAEWLINRLWQSSVVPLAAGRGLCTGWWRRWCPTGAGPGDGCRTFPCARRPPSPAGTSRGRRRWRWTARDWTRPPRSPWTCRPRQSSFPVVTDGWNGCELFGTRDVTVLKFHTTVIVTKIIIIRKLLSRYFWNVLKMLKKKERKAN